MLRKAAYARISPSRLSPPRRDGALSQDHAGADGVVRRLVDELQRVHIDPISDSRDKPLNHLCRMFDEIFPAKVKRLRVEPANVRIKVPRRGALFAARI